MFSRTKKVMSAAANSETALNVAGDYLTHNEWLELERRVNLGTARVSVINGALIITTNTSDRIEELTEQMDLNL